MLIVAEARRAGFRAADDAGGAFHEGDAPALVRPVGEGERDSWGRRSVAGPASAGVPREERLQVLRLLQRHSRRDALAAGIFRPAQRLPQVVGSSSRRRATLRRTSSGWPAATSRMACGPAGETPAPLSARAPPVPRGAAAGSCGGSTRPRPLRRRRQRRHPPGRSRRRCRAGGPGLARNINNTSGFTAAISLNGDKRHGCGGADGTLMPSGGGEPARRRPSS